MLSTEIYAGQYGSSVSFSVNPSALHQGFYVFKKALTSLSHVLVPMAGKKGVMNIEGFMDLPERSKGLEIIFVWTKRDATMDLPTVLSKICEIANYLLTKSGYSKSKFVSLAELSAFLWQESMKPVVAEAEILTVCKRRKTASELGSKMLSSYGKEIIEYVTTNFCLNDTDSYSTYLEAAVKESLKDMSHLDSVSKKIFSDEIIETEQSKFFASVMNDPRVVESVSLYPKKNIVFTSVEKDLVMCLFDVIMTVMIEGATELNPKIIFLAATVTKTVLAHHPIFSELIVSTIERWHISRGVVANKPGRKRYQNFEAEVWGKLLICEFENKMVRFFFVNYINIKQ